MAIESPDINMSRAGRRRFVLCFLLVSAHVICAEQWFPGGGEPVSVCGTETLNLACPNGTLVTFHDVLGGAAADPDRNDTCAYEEGDCCVPAEQWNPPTLHTCNWGQQECQLTNPFFNSPDCIGPGSEADHITAVDFQCIPEPIIHRMCIAVSTNSTMGYIMDETYPASGVQEGGCTFNISFYEETTLRFQFLTLDIQFGCPEQTYLNVISWPSGTTVQAPCVLERPDPSCSPNFINESFLLTGEMFSLEFYATDSAFAPGFLLFYHNVSAEETTADPTTETRTDTPSTQTTTNIPTTTAPPTTAPTTTPTTPTTTTTTPTTVTTTTPITTTHTTTTFETTTDEETTTTTTTPTPTTTPPPAGTEVPPDGGLGGGIIFLIILLCVAAVVGVVLGVWYYLQTRGETPMYKEPSRHYVYHDNPGYTGLS